MWAGPRRGGGALPRPEQAPGGGMPKVYRPDVAFLPYNSYRKYYLPTLKGIPRVLYIHNLGSQEGIRHQDFIPHWQGGIVASWAHPVLGPTDCVFDIPGYW
jgi:hypothetical protein